MNDNEKAAETAEETAHAAEGAEGVAEEAAAREAGEAQEAPADAACADAGLIEKLKDEIAAEKDRNIRLLADFDNFRRRVAREKNETYQRAAEATIAEFLPVLDNFDRAIAQAPEAGDAFADGVRMVYGQLSDVLAKAGVTPVQALGAPFNPAEHEAIAYQPSADAPEGQVIYEAKRGYRMGDRVIRPASVIVSSGAPQAAEPAPAAETAEAPAQEE
ncbi:MAG: nucleotide exchange factor GrpE [Kiritimatiellae bacterium]|nr:nucleotide exchange factor GrpE [Kiritimatiellia bacterium]